MIEKGEKRAGEEDLRAMIHAQLRDPANRHHLSRMPAFRVDSDTDEVFSELLERLESAEIASGSRHGGGRPKTN